MATIIRTSRKSGIDRASSFNFDDMASQAGEYLDDVRRKAQSILADAQSEADAIRQRAQSEGKQAAQQDAQQLLETRISETLLPAMDHLVGEVARAKETWVAEWERQLVHLASAIAAKIVRREIEKQPEIALEVVRESLAMAAGCPQLKVRLSTADYESLGTHVQQLADHVGSLGDAEVVADASITPGGCRVETEFGVIDQQIDSQMKRIVEELT